MLVGAFTAVSVSYFSGSWLFGVVAAMLGGALITMLMALGHIKYNSEICAIGMGINLFAIAITKFLMQVLFKTNGTFSNPDIIPIPRVHISFLEKMPILDQLLNDWCLTEWFAILFIIILQFLFYKTVWGLRLRAVGQFPMAAQTAGIHVNAVKYQAMLISGLIGGLAGARLQAYGFPAQFVLMMSSRLCWQEKARRSTFLVCEQPDIGKYAEKCFEYCTVLGVGCAYICRLRIADDLREDDSGRHPRKNWA